MARQSEFLASTDHLRRQHKLQEAVRSVHDGMSIRRAAEEYSIPKSTVYDHASGRVALHARRGRNKHLDSFEEESLASFLINCANFGCARTTKEAIGIAQELVDQKGKEAKVTSSWWKSFLSRHPEISLRVSESVSKARALGMNRLAIEKYFNLLSEVLDKGEVMNRPCQIFNLDETGMPLDPPPPKIVAKKGQKHPTSIGSGKKGQVTILACVSAGGYCMPPLVIFNSRTLQNGMDIGEVPGTMYGLSETGWINGDIFSEWFAFHFLKYAPPARPLLLLMDGHSSHFTPDFIHKAASEDVIVMSLPPNSTHRIQPLDKGVFSPLKQAWREECHIFLLKNQGKVISKFSFSQIFSKAWLKSMTPSNIISGFHNTGIYPLDKTKLLPPQDKTRESVRSYYTPFLSLQPLHASPQPQSHLHFHIYQSTPRPNIHTEGSSSTPCVSPCIPRASVQFTSPHISTPHTASHIPSVHFASPHNSTPVFPSHSDMSLLEDSTMIHGISVTNSKMVGSKTQDDLVFTTAEVAKYRRRQEEGFDIADDSRYNAWLRQNTAQNHSDSDESNLLKPTGMLSKVLDRQVSCIKLPIISNPSSSAKVITSEENRKRLKEKEEQRVAEATRKELEKKERERKREEKNENKKKQQKQRFEARLKKIDEQLQKMNQERQKIERQLLSGSAVVVACVCVVCMCEYGWSRTTHCLWCLILHFYTPKSILWIILYTLFFAESQNNFTSQKFPTIWYQWWLRTTVLQFLYIPNFLFPSIAQLKCALC